MNDNQTEIKDENTKTDLTGVGTLKFLSIFLLIISIIVFLIFIFLFIQSLQFTESGNRNTNWFYFYWAVASIICGLFNYGFCRAIATITESTLNLK